MARKYVLDTHALIWYLAGSARLGSAAKAVMDDPASEMVLPLIALAEAVYVVEKGRTSIPSVTDLLNDVTSEARIEIYPLTFEVLQQSLAAGVVPEMHDRLIVATGLYLESLGHEVFLLTVDADITASKLVTTVW
jgi:PIN domain nuclease of toxin-antitoxin system